MVAEVGGRGGHAEAGAVPELGRRLEGKGEGLVLREALEVTVLWG